LTVAGAAALGPARAVLAAADALRQAVDDVAGLIRGRLVVGMVNGCTIAPLFDALAAFHRAHPGVEIVLVEDNSQRLTEAVCRRGADVALIGTAGPPPPGLHAMAIASERLVAAVPPNHALAKRKRVTVADVSAYPIVCMPKGTAPRAMFDQACAAQGVSPDIVLQASAPDAVADLAKRELGVAILTESMAARHDNALRALRIADIQQGAGLAMIWTTTTSPALREFVAYSREAFADPRPERALATLDRATP